MTLNHNLEQIARDHIDTQLATAGWVVQPNKAIDLSTSDGESTKRMLAQATRASPQNHECVKRYKAVSMKFMM